MTERGDTASSKQRSGWLSRHPTVAAVSAAAGLFCLLQGLVLLLKYQDFDVHAATGMAKLGLITGLPTVLLLVPIVLLVRRWHPDRELDAARATRSLLFGLTAALGVWMIVDFWVSGPLFPRAVEPWIEIAAALGIGLLVARRPPSETFVIRAAPLLLVALALSFVPSEGPGRAPESSSEVSPTAATPPTGDRPDVVLVSIDTLRADKLGAYGQSPTLTPEMDRLAAEGFVFDRALAASPWTVPSVASMLTGLPTIHHGAGLPFSSGMTLRRTPLDPDVATLAERFLASGYRTRAVVANGFLSPEMGMARGFEEFDLPIGRAMGAIFGRDVPLGRLLLALFPVESWGDFRAQGLTDRALEILSEADDRPLFLWVHYIDPHVPFQADPTRLDVDALSAEIRGQQPEVLEDGTVVGEVFTGTTNLRGGMLWIGPEDRRRIEVYYDRAVEYVDREIGRLFVALRERPNGRRVVAALTADHGEEFWDHGGFEHGHDYYREVTRVPLVFWAPGSVPAGRSADGPVGLVDVAPTLLELAGLEAPTAEAPDVGRSLVSRWHPGAPASGDGERLIRFSGGNLYGLPAVLLEDGPWRFILRANGTQELYDIVHDPMERDNQASRNPELVERYTALLQPRLARFLEHGGRGAAEMNPETLKALRALGYVQ